MFFRSFRSFGAGSLGAAATCSAAAAAAVSSSSSRFTCCDGGNEVDEFGLDIPSADASDVKAPGQFETWDQSCRALTQVACFKGAKLQNTKPITPNFVVQHNVQLGESPQDPNASEHYSVMAQVFNETGVVMSTLHQNGVLEATVWSPALPFNKSMGAKMVFVMGPQQDMVWGDAEYTGDSFNTQARMGLNVMGWKGPMMQMSYTQTLNPRLSLGAEIAHQAGAVVSPFALTGKFDTAHDTSILMLKTHAQPVQNASDQAMPALDAHYVRKVVPDRVSLGATLSVLPAAMQTSCVFGAEFQLHQSTVSTAIDPSGGKLSTTVRAKLAPQVGIDFSGEMTYGVQGQNPQTGAPSTSDEYRFGMGLALG
jgi:hypothetical protein